MDRLWDMAPWAQTCYWLLPTLHKSNASKVKDYKWLQTTNDVTMLFLVILILLRVCVSICGYFASHWSQFVLLWANFLSFCVIFGCFAALVGHFVPLCGRFWSLPGYFASHFCIFEVSFVVLCLCLCVTLSLFFGHFVSHWGCFVLLWRGSDYSNRLVQIEALDSWQRDHHKMLVKTISS